MKYYQFHIGDYYTHTAHLDPLEDIAYRRLMDWQYLHEQPLPLDIEYICKAIRMRTHNDCITYVLREFFEETENGYINPRIDHEIARCNEKSEKARLSAMARWAKEDDANALQTQSDCNATQTPNNPNTQTPKRRKAKAFAPPTLEDCQNYKIEKCPLVDAKFFYEYFSENDWVDSKGNAVKSWKQKMLTWQRSEESKNKTETTESYGVGGI